MSYDEAHGAPDTTGADDGRDKIDTFVYDEDTPEVVARFIADSRAEPYTYAFIHLRDPDATGHWLTWSVRSESRYMQAVQRADARIGEVMDFIESDPRLAGHTALIVTADHGGSGHSHYAEKVKHYTVPFYVWGPGIPAADLYALNEGIREDPGTENVGFDATLQPIRNGEAANLALSLLGLGPVPGSTLNEAEPLRVRVEKGRAAGPAAAPEARR